MKWYWWVCLAILLLVIPGGVVLFFAWPVKGRISSKFGPRTSPISGKAENHPGIDIAAPAASPIVCIMDGVVSRSYTSESYGERVILKHNDGYGSTYNHMSSRVVKEGQKVKKGDLIGTVGSTGWSTGNHLHFEVTLNGKFIDPVPMMQG